MEADHFAPIEIGYIFIGWGSVCWVAIVFGVKEVELSQNMKFVLFCPYRILGTFAGGLAALHGLAHRPYT
jgi:hypothetical protein